MYPLILLMEEILHHLGWLDKLPTSTCAGFLPSTVCILSSNFWESSLLLPPWQTQRLKRDIHWSSSSIHKGFLGKITFKHIDLIRFACSMFGKNNYRRLTTYRIPSWGFPHLHPIAIFEAAPKNAEKNDVSQNKARLTPFISPGMSLLDGSHRYTQSTQASTKRAPWHHHCDWLRPKDLLHGQNPSLLDDTKTTFT